MQIADPDGIQPLVVDTEWREKSPRSDGQVGIYDVVSLEIINIFSNHTFVRTVAVIASKLSLKCCPGFNQPTTSQRHQEHWGDLWRKPRLPTIHIGEVAGVTGKNGNWTFVVGILCD